MLLPRLSTVIFFFLFLPQPRPHAHTHTTHSRIWVQRSGSFHIYFPKDSLHTLTNQLSKNTIQVKGRLRCVEFDAKDLKSRRMNETSALQSANGSQRYREIRDRRRPASGRSIPRASPRPRAFRRAPDGTSDRQAAERHRWRRPQGVLSPLPAGSRPRNR